MTIENYFDDLLVKHAEYMLLNNIPDISSENRMIMEELDKIIKGLFLYEE